MSAARRHPVLPVFGALLLVGLVGIAFISYLRARELLQRQISGTILPLTTDTIGAGLEHDLLQPVLASGLMARNTLLAEKIAAGERDPRPILDYLRSTQERTGAVTAFLVSDRSLRYYHPNGVLKRVSPSDTQDRWYYRFRSSGKNFEINIDRDTADPGRTTAFINVRLLDRGGRFLGAVGLGLDIRSLMAELRHYQQRYGGRILLLDRQGRIQLAADRTSGRLEEIEALAPHRNRILAASPASLQVRHGRDDLFLSSRPIPGLDWVLLVQQTSSLDQRKLENLLAHNLVVAAAGSVLLLLLAHAMLGRQQRELERLASTDSLTGLLNRSVFESLFALRVSASRRSGRPLAAALIDIDRFKQVNDLHGHPQGDRVIRAISSAISRHARPGDLLFRWGGEEFLLLLPGCPQDQAEALLERLRLAIENDPVDLPPAALPVTISIGLSLHRPEESSSVLLQRLDEALYTAKRGGRNRLSML